MVGKGRSRHAYLAAIIAIGTGIAGSGGVRAIAAQRRAVRAAPAASPSGIPDDVQLVNSAGNPTIRMPVAHSSLNWTLIKPRVRASYGWLEIDRASVRYNLSRPSRLTKEADQPFACRRTEITDLKMEYGAAEFRASGLRNFFGYLSQNHWDAADSTNGSMSSVGKADALYSPVILRALQSFDSVVAELRLRQQAAEPPPVVVQPAPPPAPKPAAPAAPPTLIVTTPSVASDNQTLEVSQPTLTIRGVAMDDAGLPTITINGVPASLRPKNEKVAEFWSDPIILAPGATHFQIVATSPAKATAHLAFIAQFTPQAAPVNPRGLDKAAIIALLQGSVPPARVAQIVTQRGIKFSPVPGDLEDIRAAGGTDDVIAAIKQAAPAP